MEDDVIVHKLSPSGETLLSYAGRLVARSEEEVVLEASFQRERMELDYVTLTPGDRFVEYFYSGRWYNIFAIYDGEDGGLKGWYCNITRPAVFEDAPDGGLEVRAVDLALDYFLQPGGREFVLDEVEFAALGLAPAEEAAALAALAELRRLAGERAGPFGLAT